MKKRIFLLCTLLSFCIVQTAVAAQTIKLGVVTKPGSAQNIVADKFKELVEQRSKGAYKVKVFHSKSIGNETETSSKSR